MTTTQNETQLETDKRIDYAKRRFAHAGIRYEQTDDIGIFQVFRRSDGYRFTYDARTGRIQGNDTDRGIGAIVKLATAYVKPQ